MHRFSFLYSIFKTSDSSATILIRILVSVVFIPEGIQKLAFAGVLGSGRFASIGIPFPYFFGPLVGSIEITCGLLILIGFLTRLASIPLIIVMIVAIISTKIPILLDEDWWIFHLPALSRYGFWSMMHELRADTSMLFASLYLFIRGAGQCSFDAWVYKECSARHPTISIIPAKRKTKKR